MHNLSASFVLGYHGCSRSIGERLLTNEAFQPSTNEYDWLGSGIYFWEANPDRAFEWATQHVEVPFVVGAVIDPGFCLDLITSNGIRAIEDAYVRFQSAIAASGAQMPINSGGDDLLLRKLDCAVINLLHAQRDALEEQSFDTVRGLFMEGEPVYKNSGFRRKTHIQLCVRSPEKINGVFRVPERHFTS